jgi:hypothetical protein
MSPIDTTTYAPPPYAFVTFDDGSFVAGAADRRRIYTAVSWQTPTSTETAPINDDVSILLADAPTDEHVPAEPSFVPNATTDAERAVDERNELLARRYAGIHLSREQDTRLRMLKIKILELIPFATQEDYATLAAQLQEANAMDVELDEIRADLARV